MKKIISNIAQAILPARCPLSGEIVPEPGLVAPAVWGKLDLIARPFCACCGVRFDVPVEEGTLCPACVAEPPPFDLARSVLAYDDVSREMILSFKHADQMHLTRTFLPWLTRVGAEMYESGMIIVPVPLHRLRLFKRRYNQAAVLAQAIAGKWGAPYRPDILVRARATPSQGHLTRAQRQENVAGAFVVPANVDISGLSVMIIDDVFTTGATVAACARTLKRAGVRKVVVLTLARVMSSRPL